MSAPDIGEIDSENLKEEDENLGTLNSKNIFKTSERLSKRKSDRKSTRKPDIEVIASGGGSGGNSPEVSTRGRATVCFLLKIPFFPN